MSGSARHEAVLCLTSGALKRKRCMVSLSRASSTVPHLVASNRPAEVQLARARETRQQSVCLLRIGCVRAQPSPCGEDTLVVCCSSCEESLWSDEWPTGCSLCISRLESEFLAREVVGLGVLSRVARSLMSTSTTWKLCNNTLEPLGRILLVPWRADPAGCTAISPWERRLARAGAAFECEPLEAQRRPSCAGGSSRLPRHAASLMQLRCYLHETLLRRWWVALRDRRRDFGAGPETPDFEAMRRVASPDQRPDDAATLRVVISGAALPEADAAPWAAVGPLRPHCGVASEALCGVAIEAR